MPTHPGWRVRLGALLLLAVSAACATPGAGRGEAAFEDAIDVSDVTAIRERWGVEVLGLHPTAAGAMLDFRYRVVDPSRAAPLLDGKQRPYLLDGRGAKLGVPETPILGSLRQTGRNGKISTDHTYFVLFANPAKYLRPGDRVTLAVGDARLSDLTVE